MGWFDRLRRRRYGETQDAREAGAGGADDFDDDPDDEDADGGPVVAVAVVREGHNVPTEEDMRALLAEQAPEYIDLPKTGLNQMRWWREADWVAGGMVQIAVALRRTYGIDPDKTTWTLCKDDRGARCGIVFLRK